MKRDSGGLNLTLRKKKVVKYSGTKQFRYSIVDILYTVRSSGGRVQHVLPLVFVPYAHF